MGQGEKGATSTSDPLSPPRLLLQASCLHLGSCHEDVPGPRTVGEIEDELPFGAPKALDSHCTGAKGKRGLVAHMAGSSGGMR